MKSAVPLPLKIDFSKLRILVADDNAYSRRILRGLLLGFGTRTIYEADDGPSAFETFMTMPCDIAILDWEMPILSGAEVTRLMRNPTMSPNPYVPIIMCSGYSEKSRVTMSRDTGASDFLAKPFSTALLYQRIATVVTSPKPFIRTSTYFGPTRRALRPNGEASQKRRRSDKTIVAEPTLIPIDIETGATS